MDNVRNTWYLDVAIMILKKWRCDASSG